MTSKPFFPWLKHNWNRPPVRRPMISSRTRELRDRMAHVEHRIQTCPIAPVQEQMQTVWFHLVHEYLKNKRKAVNDDSSHE